MKSLNLDHQILKNEQTSVAHFGVSTQHFGLHLDHVKSYFCNIGVNIIEHPDIRSRVYHILQELKLPHKSIERVESFSNAVWMTDDHVVHYHVIGSIGRLEHEARVAVQLPPEALYPEVVAVGRDGDHDWLVTKRVRGVSLSEAWPCLTPAERQNAISQAANALKAIHHSSTTHLVPPCLQGDAPVLSRQELKHRLQELGKLPSLEGLLKNNMAPSVMAHGDFNFNQVLWHEGKVTALLDIEMSHLEAPDWDIASFLGFCINPVRSVPTHLEAISKVEDYYDAPKWLQEAYPEMFAFPHLRDRLALHFLVLRFKELDERPNRHEEILGAVIVEADKLMALLPKQ